ncbi:MAG: hypothetical protein AAFS10_18485 [Myxococcota bacterium]
MTIPFRATWRTLLSCIGTFVAFMLLSTGVHAQECETDDDCSGGDVCKVVAASSRGPSSEQRECVTPPITCETDNDCPTELSCQHPIIPGVCTIDADGNEMCTDDEPGMGPGSCEFIPRECTDTTECAESFVCENIGTCIGSCDGLGNCQEACDSQWACIPDQIACESDRDCPTDWACHTFIDMVCSCSSGCIDCPGCVPGEECPSCDDGEPRPPSDEVWACEEIRENFCLPPGWDAWADGVAVDNTVSNSTNSAAMSGGDKESTVAGCTVGYRSNSGTGVLVLFIAVVFAALRRR